MSAAPGCGSSVCGCFRALPALLPHRQLAGDVGDSAPCRTRLDAAHPAACPARGDRRAAVPGCAHLGVRQPCPSPSPGARPLLSCRYYFWGSPQRFADLLAMFDMSVCGSEAGAAGAGAALAA